MFNRLSQKLRWGIEVDIYEFLERHEVNYRKVEHPPVFTCEEARELVPDLGAAETKNLFVKDKKGRNHFLLVIGYEKKVDLSALKTKLGVNNLSFCSPDRLMRFLGVEPGSVTILGLANDTENAVKLVFDRDLWNEDCFGCHPLVNTATLVIDKHNLERFLGATGHEPMLLDLD